MSKLNNGDREALYASKGESDALRGEKNPPGMSLIEKAALTFVTAGAAAPVFIPTQEDRERAAYLDGHARGSEIRKITGR